MLDVAIIIGLAIITAALSMWAWNGFEDEMVKGRRGRIYSLEMDPISYFIIEGVRVFLAGFCAWKLLMKIEDFINPPKKIDTQRTIKTSTLQNALPDATVRPRRRRFWR